MRFVDSHVHLSDYPDVASVIRSSKSTHVTLCACSVNRASSARTLGLAREDPDAVRAFVGVHPSEAQAARELDWLPDLVDRASGVGEIGLDPKYPETEAGLQRKLFLEQLEMAERKGKPVQVHSRNQEAACLDELASHRLKAVLLHWFSGEQELGRAEGKGYFVSFGPALLESKKLQRMAARYDGRLILTESDGPVGFASLGGAEGPLAVPSVAFKLADVRRLRFDEMAEILVDNTSVFLSASGKL